MVQENHIWITAREEKIPVISMLTEHIQNCINCFNGIGNIRIPSTYLGGKDKWLSIFNEELNRRAIERRRNVINNL